MKHEEKFETVSGQKDAGDLTVFALSTCGFCKRALAYLRNKSVKFKFLYVDDLPEEIKDEIKEYLFAKFHEQVRFPFLVINGEKYLVGFTEEEWKTALGVD